METAAVVDQRYGRISLETCARTVQYQESLPLADAISVDDDERQAVGGKTRYYVGGDGSEGSTSIVTPHSIVGAPVHQYANTKCRFPIKPEYGGFVINFNGSTMLITWYALAKNSVQEIGCQRSVIARTEQEARDIANEVKGYSKAGKESGSYAPFGV